MTQGTVKWFNNEKGYGLIRPHDGGKDVFVDISAVERAGMHGLNEKQKCFRAYHQSLANNLRAVRLAA
jgi:CspA family cold shock protein